MGWGSGLGAMISSRSGAANPALFKGRMMVRPAEQQIRRDTRSAHIKIALKCLTILTEEK